MAISEHFNCPDCGAPLKKRDPTCWMCSLPIRWEGGQIASGPTSYFADQPRGGSPPVSQPRVRYETRVLPILGIIFGAMAMVPAALVACVVTCSAILLSDMRNAEQGNVALLVGAASGLVVLVAFIVFIVMMATKVSRRLPI